MAFIEQYFLEDVNKPTEPVTPIGSVPGGIVPRENLTQDNIDSLQNTQNTTLVQNDPFFEITADSGTNIVSNVGEREFVIGNTKPILNEEKSDEVIVNIIASSTRGEAKATILKNGIPLEGGTPKRYSIRKSELFVEGPQTITVRSFGYDSDERYVFSVIPREDSNIPIEDINILRDSKDPSNIIGLQNLRIDVKSYKGDDEIEYVLDNGNFITLPFTLTAVSDNKDISLEDENKEVEVSTMVISMDGPDASVIVSSNGESDFLNRGTEEFKDSYGTKYFIKTSSPKLYRIAEITVIDSNGKSEVLKAGASESLSTEIVLSGDVKVSVLSRRLVKVEKRKPEIRLKSVGTQTYNINDKTDIPIIIEKNDAVRAISLIIGEEILEFDDVKQGRYMGIEIPHNLVEKIGQYQIKLFPYAISELAKGKPEKDVPKYDDLPKVTPDEVPVDDNLFTPRPVDTDLGPRIPDVSPRPVDTDGKSRTPDVSPRPFVPDSGPRTSGTRGVGDNVSQRPQGGGRPFIPDLGPKTPKVIARPPSNRILPSNDGRIRGK